MKSGYGVGSGLGGCRSGVGTGGSTSGLLADGTSSRVMSGRAPSGQAQSSR
jgi:hypothetical protein